MTARTATSDLHWSQHRRLHSLGVPISNPGSLRAIFGAALFMTGVGLLGLGCGFIIRNTGGAIAALFGLLLVLPLLAQALPSSL